VGRHRTFLQQEEDHSLTVAVTALQRAVKAWLKTRWKRRFYREDDGIVLKIKQEEQQEERLDQEKQWTLKNRTLEIRHEMAKDDSQQKWKPTPKGWSSKKRDKPVNRLVPSRAER
jgi:hypothetical protein